MVLYYYYIFKHKINFQDRDYVLGLKENETNNRIHIQFQG